MAARRIIRGVRPAAGEPGTDDGRRRGRVVIADSGVAAEVLLLPGGETAGPGVTFHYRGATWVITGERRDSGIPVAEPAGR